jgi:outer membrane protein
MKLKHVLLSAIFIIACGTVQAQKFGHIDSGALLELMPEVKSADSMLAKYQKSLEDSYNSMITEYQTKLADFQKKEKTMQDYEKELKQQELMDLQNRLQTFQDGAQDKLQAKKQEVYSPILKKAEDAVKAVAKENGYAYVFDTSVGAVIYAQDSDNIMPLVKKKLNLK